MKLCRRDIFRIIMFFVAIVFLAISLVHFLNQQKFGLMRVTVRDGFSDEPIEGAIVVIPETNQQYVTDKEGKTELIQVPLIRDKHHSKLLKQDYGLTTVLVYCDGYVPYALFFTHVENGTMRNGPNVWLFPEPGDPFVIIEAPKGDWCNELIEMYRPE
ncbi:MAG: carboxypeptidase-like regulatory domain-containing protein [Clostridiales bacterium]|nr:carboxypeptidase-like regulatory domain-containing protein [Clostridiales bacterium]